MDQTASGLGIASIPGSALLRAALVGAMVLVAAAGIGWEVGRRPGSWLARATGVWFARVARPVLTQRSWLRRVAIIAGNNSITCGVLVVAGAGGPTAWLALALVGLCLGCALRFMLQAADGTVTEAESSSRQQLLAALGFLLNLLEVPAILLSVALSLTQGALADVLTWDAAVGLFARWVLPLLLVAAGGEALWMTVCDVHLKGPDEGTG
ncbi:MAG TPA: hypothetical protein PKK06_11785 [Phycisphaerae bacterium]|nr:hypothetical protein [Phycisphaerae bacterium]HNU46027.1 hypothetical protein [Phycisphaerae bacterium]